MRDHFDYCLEHKKDIEIAIYNAKHDKGVTAGTGGHSGISKPTERDALYNLQIVKEVTICKMYVVSYPQRMINVIDYTRAYFNDRADGIIYKARYIDKEDWNVTCERLNISKTNYYKRVNKILRVAKNRWKYLKEYENGY